MVPCFVTCNFALRFTMKTSGGRNPTDSRDPPQNPPHSEFPSHFLKKNVFVMVSFFVKCNFALRGVFPSSVFFKKGFVIRKPRRSRQIRLFGISFAFFEKNGVCDGSMFCDMQFCIAFYNENERRPKSDGFARSATKSASFGISFAFFEKKRVCDGFIFCEMQFCIAPRLSFFGIF